MRTVLLNSNANTKIMIPGNSGKYKYWFNCKKDHAIDLSINGSTFMGKITGSTAYFIGNVRGDLIHIYDREDSLHLNYRISGCMPEQEVGDSCKSCWMTIDESVAGVRQKLKGFSDFKKREAKNAWIIAHSMHASHISHAV